MDEMVVGIQARSDSTRFPNKAMADICGKPAVRHVIDAAMEARVGEVYLLVPEGDPLIQYGEQIHGLHVLPGPKGDLTAHYRLLAEKRPAMFYMRLTGDCPLIPKELILEAFWMHRLNRQPYWGNRIYYPDGFDIEIFSQTFLRIADAVMDVPEHRNHAVHCFSNDPIYKLHHLHSLDTEEDLEPIRKVKAKLGQAG